MYEDLKKVYPEYTGRIAYNTIDLTGKRFGNLLVLYRTLNKNSCAQWICQCQCEKKTICVKRGVDLRSGSTTGCGCTKTGNLTKEIEPGTIFNSWQIIKRVENKNNQVYYLCKCLKCNETLKEVSRKNLISGQSKRCRACAMKDVGLINSKDETNKTYGFLYVNRRATENEKPRNDKTGVFWNCTCLKCGRENVIVFGDYLRNGDTSSCGCILSKNESKISKILDENQIKYNKQYLFNDLTSTGRLCDRLPFDFGVVNNNNKLLYLIEYDGEQHFDKSHSWSELGFDRTRENDLKKNKYCFDNNIPLIRIPYDAKYTFEDLMLETTRFLLTPENEEEYYKSRMKKIEKE